MYPPLDCAQLWVSRDGWGGGMLTIAFPPAHSSCSLIRHLFTERVKEKGSKSSDRRQGGGLVWEVSTALTAREGMGCAEARGWGISERLLGETFHLILQDQRLYLTLKHLVCSIL